MCPWETILKDHEIVEYLAHKGQATHMNAHSASYSDTHQALGPRFHAMA